MSCCRGHHHRGDHHRDHHHDHHNHRGCRCRDHSQQDRDCCCGNRGHHGGGRFHRRYFTRDEEIERLEEYLNDLQAEIEAVEERLAALRDRA